LLKNAFAATARSKSLIAGVLSITSITIGVILLVEGLYLIILDASLPLRAGEASLTVQSVAFVLEALPGIPLCISDLAYSGITALGLISWIVGLDILLVGLGLWAKHKIAQWAAFFIFLVAAFFDFVQLLLFGFVGSPNSAVGLSLNGLILYLLLKLEF